jgi:hypothetical protein
LPETPLGQGLPRGLGFGSISGIAYLAWSEQPFDGATYQFRDWDTCRLAYFSQSGVVPLAQENYAPDGWAHFRMKPRPAIATSLCCHIQFDAMYMPVCHPLNLREETVTVL